MSASSLDKKFEERKTKIESAFSTAKAVRGIPNHPNPDSHKGMDANIQATNASVLDAWQSQYDQQLKVLVWPSELSEDFVAQVNKFRPIEVVPPPPTPRDQELREEYLEEYRNYIKDELPKLAEQIGAAWLQIGRAHV